MGFHGSHAAARPGDLRTSDLPNSTDGAAYQKRSGRHRGYEPVRARTATVCQWVRYNVPYGATATNVDVRALRSVDDRSAIEIQRMASGSRTTARGFEYHCLKPGSAVITFRALLALARALNAQNR